MFDFINAPFELAHFILKAGETTTEHNHIDREIFICLDGKAKIQLDKKHIYTLTKNEIMLVNKYQFHQIINENDTPITMFSLSWS
ncbi:MAG: Cupin domain [Burkholderiales bacterium]|jgi:mannose-6-phosphate isomerase-like protein (cupin superfamily)|nr:Cupin domain [Burkholderiales bacterium]